LIESNATHHRSRVIGVGAVEGLDVLELEHVPLHEGLADLLVGPRDEELVVVVGLLRHPRGEVDRGLEVHSLPAAREPRAALLLSLSLC